MIEDYVNGVLVGISLSDIIIAHIRFVYESNYFLSNICQAYIDYLATLPPLHREKVLGLLIHKYPHYSDREETKLFLHSGLCTDSLFMMECLDMVCQMNLL